MKTLKVIVEPTVDGIWGRWEDAGGLVVARGDTLDDLKREIIDAINLYLEDKDVPALSLRRVDFTFYVDLVNLFAVHDFINISRLAEHIGMNKSLLRQYARGIKYPGLEQALKIEQALKGIASNLLSTKVITRER